MYVETDFLLSLFKKEDWLKKKAENIYNKHKGELWTSTITLLEMLLWARREGYEPAEVIEGVSSLVEIKDINLNYHMLLAVSSLMNEYKLTPFDALHAFIAKDTTIVSSERKYDKIGLKRIRLED